MKDSQDNINNFGRALEDFTEQFEMMIGVQNQVNILICQAICMACCCAPTELAGMKTIMQALENGILQYEDRHQEDVKKMKEQKKNTKKGAKK